MWLGFHKYKQKYGEYFSWELVTLRIKFLDPGTRGLLALARDKGDKFRQWCNVELPEPSYCPGFSPLFITMST